MLAKHLGCAERSEPSRARSRLSPSALAATPGLGVQEAGSPLRACYCDPPTLQVGKLRHGTGAH